MILNFKLIISWTLFFIGDVISTITEYVPEFIGTPLTGLYSIVMGWSVDLQGTSSRGPWDISNRS